MSPFARAKQVFESEPCAYTFADCALFHANHGNIFSGKDYLVMARPVISSIKPDWIVGLNDLSRFKCDCWHIAIMVGSMEEAWKRLPYELPMISYERSNVLRFAPLNRIRSLSTILSHETSQLITTPL
tara:strand:- start:4251 stop:4634 length:384 start_codon:yes stop_codon:yes gene_type:complete